MSKIRRTRGRQGCQGKDKDNNRNGRRTLQGEYEKKSEDEKNKRNQREQ